jgi:excinuclease ABC subunit A
MVELGLGYLVLGEQAANLSRGELQRVQLAKYLQRTSNLRKKLFIFDEPSLGLHLSELPLLLKGLQRLIKQGHSVIAIEHNLNFIKNADYLIELGPEAGENGGEIISAGTLESIPEFSTSKIAKYLNTNLIS